VRLELEKQYGSEMRWRRNSKKHGLESREMRLNSAELSLSRGV
jgi:hypothetical protein